MKNRMVTLIAALLFGCFGEPTTIGPSSDSSSGADELSDGPSSDSSSGADELSDGSSSSAASDSSGSSGDSSGSSSTGGAWCAYHDDGECDEPEGTGLCEEGSDVYDCTCNDATTGAPDCPPSYLNDGECDEPEGTDVCPEGSDVADCFCGGTGTG